jgi:hypothetical protein
LSSIVGDARSRNPPPVSLGALAASEPVAQETA